MDEELQIARIEDYLFGSMTDAERALFEKELSSNPELNKLYREHKFFVDGIEGMKAEAFIEKLRQKHGQISKQNNQLKLFRRISVAAAVIFIGGLIYFLIEPAGPKAMANKYYEAPFAQIQRSNPPPEDSLYETGMRAFSNQDWSKAIASFNTIGKEHKFYARSLYYTAHSYVGQKDYTKALELFNEPAFNDGQYVQQAEWYRVLMKMFLKYPEEEIIADFKKIESDQGHFYREKAIKLLNKLEK